MNNEAKAIDGIRKACGTGLGEYSIDEFVLHHIDELPAAYWVKHLNTETPTSEQVVGLLVLHLKWEGEEVYDFTLPDDVTDYVVSVSFDDEGNIQEIVMES